jgi:predicted RNase H-like HicB family nuclease
MPKSQPLYCIARGRDDRWEAFCLDFDLAVQGRSCDEAVERLKTGIAYYVAAAEAEPEPTRSQLLNRRAPWLTRMNWKLRVALWALRNRSRSEEATFGFPVPCPA